MSHLFFKIIIPTYNAETNLKIAFSDIDKDYLKHFFVIDSSSEDDTTKLLNSYKIDYITIEKKAFNHGGTRQLAAERFKEADILIYMTQDAYLTSFDSIKKILSFFEDPEVGAVCGRQLPHKNATPLAQHARLFNYPDKTEIKSKKDIERLGIKVPFISNSFSAYRRSALMEMGGFPSDVILSEDMYIAAKMVLAGYKIVYSNEASCYHSHNYTPWQEFKRYFDIGAFHARESWIQKAFKSPKKEGMLFVKSELKYVWPNLYWLIRSCITSAVKLTAYKLGKKEKHIPLWLKKKLSMHHDFWNTTT